MERELVKWEEDKGVNYSFRMIDANLNRVGEGLRVLEDLVRFQGRAGLSERLRSLRHEVGKWRDEVGLAVVGFRAVASDPGRDNDHTVYQDDFELISANFSRIKEGLRVLEEAFRLVGQQDLSDRVQGARFEVYHLEGQVLIKKDSLNRKGNLYLIFDVDLIRNTYSQLRSVSALVEWALRFLEVGVDILQVRFSDDVSDRDVLAIVRGIKERLPEGRLLFVNNRPDLAYLTGVNLHIGQGDVPPVEARSIVGYIPILGQSCHSDEEIERALKDEAVDYFTIGPIFPTQTKPDYGSVGTVLLERYWKADKPFVIIGGLSAENVKDLVKYKPWAVAVCRDLLLSPNPWERVREYKVVLESI